MEAHIKKKIHKKEVGVECFLFLVFNAKTAANLEPGPEKLIYFKYFI